MKKLTSVLLAGVTAMMMNGCDDSDTPTEITSVALTDLTLGYKVSGTGDLSLNSGIDSITYCDEKCSVVWSEWGVQDYYPYTIIDGDVISEVDEIYADIDTAAAGTPGKLVVGVTYSDIDRFEGGDGWEWTITSIEEVPDCISLIPR